MAIENFNTLNGSTKLVDFTKPGWIRIEEKTLWNGSDHVSVHTGQWSHERLNVRRHNGGLLIIKEWWSQWQVVTSRNVELTIEQAKEWLAKNGDEGIEGFPELGNEVL